MSTPRRGRPARWRRGMVGGLATPVASIVAEALMAAKLAGSTGSSMPWSLFVGSGGALDDDGRLVLAGLIVLVVYGVALVALLRRVWSRRPITAPGGSDGRTESGWRREVLQLCAEGRGIVELTVETTPGEPGSGLSLADLGAVERRLELLVGRLGDAEAVVPSPIVARRLRVVSVEAGNVNDLVRTERRLRLTSVHPSTALLDATALQLTRARTSLDEALRDASNAVVSLD